MNRTDHAERRRQALLDAEGIRSYQLARLNELLAAILPANGFYAAKLAGVQLPLESLDQLSALQFTFKEELLEHGPHRDWAANLTFPVEHYVRLHQTSGTRGRPLTVLDTASDWQWWSECWQYVLDAAGLEPSDRALLAFSFGPFIGFWSARDALVDRGCLVIPGGGRDTLGRIELIRTSGATVVFCTPSYALHMAEVAAAHKIRLDTLPVRKLIVAGEPGGSVGAIRQRIEEAWDASVLDHAGATEVGPWGFGDASGSGLHVIEPEFIAEFLSVEAGSPAADGELAELVLTCLGRVGCPVIRYRTGDLVRARRPTDGDTRFIFLDGGILGRSDDMLVVRGVNIYPGAIEQILRSFPEVVEYRMTAFKSGAMDQLSIEIEDRLNQPQRVAEELRLRLGLKVDVRTVAIGTLPRFEAKGKRFIDKR